MIGLNVVAVYSPDKTRLLMCRRKKQPYLGLSNLVGGHIETGETGEDAAYRELFEETGIDRGDITLRHVMDFTYYFQGCYVELWAGRLKREVEPQGDENDLYWSPLDNNFFDESAYAGEGNIGHMLRQVEMYETEILA